MKNKIIFNTSILIRRIIYTLLLIISRETKPNIFILCYHGVSDSPWRFNVSFKNLKRQIEYLQKMYDFISLQDLEDFINGKKEILKPSVVITFDDGYEDLLKTKEFFKSKNIKPTLFVLSNRDKANRKELDNQKKLLSKDGILELSKYGWTIGSHSATHPDFYKLIDKEIDEEIIDSKHDLEKELGIRVSHFAYPKGRYSSKVLSAVKKSGYSLSFSMNDCFIDKETNRFLIPRIGVDGTHSFLEFKSIFIPSSVKFRKFIKEKIGILV